MDFIGTQPKKYDEMRAEMYTCSCCMGRLALFSSNGRIWVSMTNEVLVTVVTLAPMMKQLIMNEVKGEAKELPYKINTYTVLHV